MKDQNTNERKLNIQWFPGHMTKALRMMEENVKIVDAIGYVLDARSPLACFNPSFAKIVGNKPCVFVLNKCDLADAKKVDAWMNYFKSRNQKCIKLTATASAETSKITSALWEITTDIREKFKAKGIRYGFGGIARIGEGMLPAERIVMEHYRLGSTIVILSRSFCNVEEIGDTNGIERVFEENMALLREYEYSLVNKTEEELEKNKQAVKCCVTEIVSKIKERKAQ